MTTTKTEWDRTCAVCNKPNCVSGECNDIATLRDKKEVPLAEQLKSAADCLGAGIFWGDGSPEELLRKAAALLAADSRTLPPEYDVRKIMLKVVPGEDGMGEEIFASSVREVEDELSRLGGELEEWQLGIKRLPQPDPCSQQKKNPRMTPQQVRDGIADWIETNIQHREFWTPAIVELIRSIEINEDATFSSNN